MYPKLCYKEPCLKGLGVIAHHHCLHVNFVHMHNADIPNLKLFISKLYKKKIETQVQLYCLTAAYLVKLHKVSI